MPSRWQAHCSTQMHDCSHNFACVMAPPCCTCRLTTCDRRPGSGVLACLTQRMVVRCGLTAELAHSELTRSCVLAELTAAAQAAAPFLAAEQSRRAGGLAVHIRTIACCGASGTVSFSMLGALRRLCKP